MTSVMLMLYWTYVPCYIVHTYLVILDIRTMLYWTYVPCYIGHTYLVILTCTCLNILAWLTYVLAYWPNLLCMTNWVFLSELFTTFANSDVLDIENHYHDVFTFLSSLIKPLLVFVFLIYWHEVVELIWSERHSAMHALVLFSSNKYSHPIKW